VVVTELIIANDKHVPLWEYIRSMGDAAGYPTRIEDVLEYPKLLGLQRRH
jgi:sterol-4alpha-carboxylate 3-dehydrogenase (decarboxylating)